MFLVASQWIQTSVCPSICPTRLKGHVFFWLLFRINIENFKENSSYQWKTFSIYFVCLTVGKSFSTYGRTRNILSIYQVGFCENVCLPVYEALADLSTELVPLKEGVIANRDRWRQEWIHSLFFLHIFIYSI